MIAVSVLVDKLREMSSDDIFHFVKAENVKGRRTCPETCIIAELFHKLTGEQVRIGGDFIYHNKVSYAMSSETQEFISQFDSGKYRELIRGM